MAGSLPAAVEAERDAVLRTWCLRETAPWQARRVSRAATLREFERRNDTEKMEYLFHIRAGSVTVATKPPKTVFEVPIWRPPLYRRFLGEVVSRFCPDLDTVLLLSTRDGELGRQNVPVFAFQKPIGSNNILLPDVDFLEFDFYESNPQFRDPFSYAEKSATATFVGATSGGPVTAQAIRTGALPRLRAAAFFKDRPEVAFRLPKIVHASDEARQMLAAMGYAGEALVPWHDQFRHRFIISIDGFGATCSRLPIALRSQSVLLKYASRHLLHYFDTLQPWRHFVPIEHDSEVLDVIRIEQNSPGSFAEMVREANAFAATYLSREAAMRYTAMLLRAYDASLGDESQATEPGLRILAHIGWRGDEWFEDGDWIDVSISGRSDAGIEGLSLEPSGKAHCGGLEYAVFAEDGSQTAASAGAFCGSRGNQLRLSGFLARTIGQLADHFECEYTASFADGRREGPSRQGVACGRPGGPPLTGLRVRLAPVSGRE